MGDDARTLQFCIVVGHVAMDLLDGVMARAAMRLVARANVLRAWFHPCEGLDSSCRGLPQNVVRWRVSDVCLRQRVSSQASYEHRTRDQAKKYYEIKFYLHGKNPRLLAFYVQLTVCPNEHVMISESNLDVHLEAHRSASTR